MKKTVSIAIAAAIILLGACRALDEKEQEKPGVEDAANAINVSVPKSAQSRYINVFRRTVTVGAKGAETYGSAYNIGQILSNPSDGMVSYIYRDTLAAKGKTYQYALRYRIHAAYRQTDWSDKIAATGSAHAASPAPLPDAGARLVFHAETKTFSLTGGAVQSSPALSDYALGIAVSKDSAATVFLLPVAAGLGFPDGGIIDLRSVLSAAYLDTEVRLLGFVYQRRESRKDGAYEIIYWTEPAPVKTSDEAGKDTGGLFTVKTNSADIGSDYAPRAANAAESAPADFNGAYTVR